MFVVRVRAGKNESEGERSETAMGHFTQSGNGDLANA